MFCLVVFILLRSLASDSAIDHIFNNKIILVKIYSAKTLLRIENYLTPGKR